MILRSDINILRAFRYSLSIVILTLHADLFKTSGHEIERSQSNTNELLVSQYLGVGMLVSGNMPESCFFDKTGLMTRFRRPLPQTPQSRISVHQPPRL